jgi:hypothetical protein
VAKRDQRQSFKANSMPALEDWLWALSRKSRVCFQAKSVKKSDMTFVTDLGVMCQL